MASMILLVVSALALVSLPDAVMSSCSCEPPDECKGELTFGLETAAPDSYLDPENGRLAGFMVDVVRAVCNSENLKCNFRHVPSQQCFRDLEGFGNLVAQELASGDLDACTGWVITQTRATQAQFTVDLQEPTPVVVVGDANYATNGGEVGYIDGFFTTPECLEDQTGYTGRLRAYTSVTALNDALRSGEVGAIWSGIAFVADDLIDRVLPPEYRCTNYGSAIVARKGHCVTDVFNRGIRRMVDNGLFAELCAAGAKRYVNGENLRCREL